MNYLISLDTFDIKRVRAFLIEGFFNVICDAHLARYKEYTQNQKSKN